ncbi:MAG: signal peptidase II [Burkholderiales bacterium]
MPEAHAGMRRAWPWFAAALAVVLADQASKWLVQASLAPGERVALAPFLDLVLVFNKGAAFSFLADAPGWQRPFFIGIAAVAAVMVSTMLVREPEKRLLCAGLALILGGALGNVWDRIAYGHVVDFVLLHAGGWHWPAFNVADSAISVGAGIVIVDSLVQR